MGKGGGGAGKYRETAVATNWGWVGTVQHVDCKGKDCCCDFITVNSHVRIQKKIVKGGKGVPGNNGVCHGGPMLLFGNLTMFKESVLSPPPPNPHMINVII